MTVTFGIVGLGFVGNAVYEGMKDVCNVLTYDKYKDSVSNMSSIFDMCKQTDLIFVCVPTPMKISTGESDTSIVEEVVDEIAAGFLTKRRVNGKSSIVIKSTVPPGTCERLQIKHKECHIVFQPEFLTEANSILDFKRQNRIVIGGMGEVARSRTKKLYEHVFKSVPILETSLTSAELVKYVTNCFLATKVSFSNEMYQICNALDVQWDRVIDIASYDRRLGESHWKVPGPDGLFGWGFSCFPKDLNALRHVAQGLGIDTKILNATWEKNLEVRKEEDRDWLKMKKAVIKD